MLEEALKIYIGLSYEIIGKSVPPPVVFRFDKDKILNAPLGQLIKMISEVKDDDELINELRAIVKWRNFCAHNAFAHEFLNRASKSDFTPHDEKDVMTVSIHSAKLVERLGTELLSLREVHRTVCPENSRA